MNHHDRLLLASRIGRAGMEEGWLTVVTVTTCKRHLSPVDEQFTEDMAYLWSYRLLLERLSWLAQEKDADLGLTLAHVVRFKKSKLRAYEAVLQNLPDCKVSWDHVPQGASLSTPGIDERLQLAAIAASATWQAFEEQRGFTERRYLTELSPALWRRKGNLLSYGLKVVPHPSHHEYGWAHEL